MDKVRKFLRYHNRPLVDFAIAIASLSDKEIEAVQLCGIRCLTIEQAAEISGCSVNTMKSRWSASRKRLERCWSGIEWIDIIVSTLE